MATCLWSDEALYGEDLFVKNFINNSVETNPIFIDKNSALILEFIRGQIVINHWRLGAKNLPILRPHYGSLYLQTIYSFCFFSRPLRPEKLERGGFFVHKKVEIYHLFEIFVAVTTTCELS